ncbi:hypothetical protein M758_1G285600 [Ceratodon purpureus]|nr:hypothetical protein M758_1G285600 [Ceratodon purpureus]
MASEIPASPTLDPQLFEDWDDEDDISWKSPLDSLIKGTQTPLQVAQQIDTLLRAETFSRLQQLSDYANSHDLTPEDRESGDCWGGLYPPNAGALAQDQVIRSWCRVCEAFSPYSEGQNRLVELLEQLRQLPRWMAPETHPDENGDVVESEFWAFGRKWIGLENEFRKHHAGGVKPYYYRDLAAHNRWRNFQHAMARITAIGLMYCAPWNALSDLVIANDPGCKANVEYDIIAAAQWLVWPVECRYVYGECLKKETTEHYWEPWSKEKWRQWKLEFGRVGNCAGYDEKTRSVARQALSRMRDVEGSEGSGND